MTLNLRNISSLPQQNLHFLYTTQFKMLFFESFNEFSLYIIIYKCDIDHTYKTAEKSHITNNKVNF